MAASSRRSSTGPVIRSLSPSGRLYRNCHSSSSSSAFASSTSSFSSPSSTFFHRSSSHTRINVNLYSGASPPARSVRISLDRPISPNRSISVSPCATGNNNKRPIAGNQKRTCMCSPTTHPGSFRCSLHKSFGSQSKSLGSYSPNRLNARRSAMTNSLVRIGGVEGDLVKRALSALIRPSSHQQRRRADFTPRPSRLSIMSKAEDCV